MVRLLGECDVRGKLGLAVLLDRSVGNDGFVRQKKFLLAEFGDVLLVRPKFAPDFRRVEFVREISPHGAEDFEFF